MSVEINRVRIEVMGDDYVVKGNTDSEHIQKVGQYLKSQLEHLQQRNPQLPPKTLLFLTAFNMADDLIKLKQDYDVLATLLDQ